MNIFVDETVIDVYSGAGGNGCLSFRREKYVPRGGPDGGDGGRGGDLIFVVKRNLKTLSHLKRYRIFKGQNGEQGKGRKCHGKDGLDKIIEVPPGTLIKDFYTGELLLDLTEENQSTIFLKGGRGGKGNTHFATSRVQAPRFAQPGEPGKHRKLRAELNLIADIGLVGLPNAGKSTLLSVLTSAKPEIAPYPFTTKIPNLGVIKFHDRDIVIADIPGIIKGASQGLGLGFQFLRHISRTFLLAFLVDLSDDFYLNAAPTLEKELEGFSRELILKPRLIIGTKMDVMGTEERLLEIKEKYSKDYVIGISSVTGKGLDDLRKVFLSQILSE
ncbi:MAG: GTPase ObgE [Spirochaetales bacterium]|nr:GTPase ObgE [Spirochaetales bacterium]